MFLLFVHIHTYVSNLLILQDNEDQNPEKDLGNVNDPKNLYNKIMKHCRIFFGMGDQVPDVNNRIYEEHYLANFDFPDNDTLYNGGFQIGESSNPNLGQPHVTHDYVSPGGTLYWTPIVSDDIKPKVTSKFDSYGEVVIMYRNYALEFGFDVKLGRVKKKTKNEIITNIHMVCNREGNPNTTKIDTLDIQHNKAQRRKYLFRRNCKAKVVLDIIPDTLKYVMSDFVEQHNHELFSKGNMYLSRSKRKLDYSQEIFIHTLSKSCKSTQTVGPSVRGGLVSDFKNARRNLNCYIGGRDAKLLVDKMNDRKKNVSSFTFEYKLLNKRLNALFGLTKQQSITTIRLETLYDVVFVPFTGIDNHKKCVTFGAGLLRKEDGVSYEWLLRAFLKAFRKQPQLVISDQNSTLKKAIDNIFSLAHHRLCMFHITKKLPNKILSIGDAATNQKIRKRFHSIIWNSKLEPHDFENEFKIIDNSWMNFMYVLRRFWIPAFFKHISMSALMRTASPSESQDWSFLTTTLTGSYLIMSMMTFDSVMERQRHNQILNDFNTATTFPKFITRRPNEPHASKRYQELKIIVSKIMQTNDVDVDDKDEEYNYDCLIRDIEHTVTHSTKDGSFKYTCIHFEHVGILYRHIFCVFKFYGIEQIPEKYIMKCWRRDVIPTKLLKKRFTNSFDDSNSDMTAIDIFFNFMMRLNDFPNHDRPNRAKHFNKLLGVVVPDVVSDVSDIQNPSDIRNKGCGSRRKRLKARKKMIEKEISKPKRKYATCEHMAHHDKRNYPLKNIQK
uniref:Protein FAR1-RELATED SEQUENCE n=1 Tax=Lactuca sativa TaxID=4236 RepID=A0A9R1VFI8_LACSA|nr:hypothetical protein LSAT_V11C500288860 [Lactuca sativa]